jgi:hypothetical protein
MNEQNAKSHGRYIPLWHFITSILLLAILATSIINFIHSDHHALHSSLMFIAIAVVLIIFFFYIRLFALKAQDRAIRAEENFRHYILTGKPFDKQLRLGQVIGLRFASDEELPALAKRAVDEKLSQKQIKEAIQQWRADHHRV